MSDMETHRISFTLGGMSFEYDEEKNRKNIHDHGISFRSAARVFFDYDSIEYYDEANSQDEDRYNIIGDTSAGKKDTIIGNIGKYDNHEQDILFVVYTERVRKDINGVENDVIRLISARLATNFERGLYYGKC